jgi:hypothetical protein
MTRRQLLQHSARAAALGCLPGLTTRLRAAPTSLAKAYTLLDQMMDLYDVGATLRLSQSFVPTAALNLGNTAYTYDNAATLIAFLTRGDTDDLSRAEVLGGSLVYAQTHDPIGDGRVRDSYHAKNFVEANGAVHIAYGGTDTGNMAWTGMALAQLYNKTGQQSYLNAAVAAANWIETNTRDTRGAGGYTGGVTGQQQAKLYKSTENDLDVYALFTMLATLTGDSTWATRAQYALTFINTMWNADRGFFWIGTGTDGVTTNQHPIPEDCQSWSYLALQNPDYAHSLDWAAKHLAATDGAFSGVSFSNFDTTGVWFEGTGHMAAALLARNAPGDQTLANTYLSNIAVAQAQAPNNDGLGIDAASKNHLRTGDGGSYFAALHIGATTWYCIAAQTGNPFQL